MAERKQFISPRTPFFYVNPLLGKPFNILIAGFIPQGTEEFTSLNLGIHGKEFPTIPLPFHLSIRPKDGEMVRNSFHAGSKGWGSEERGLTSEGFPLHFGSKFDMAIHSNGDEISVTINGVNAFKFRHRIPAKEINLFETHGSIFIESICFDFL